MGLAVNFSGTHTMRELVVFKGLFPFEIGAAC